MMDASTANNNLDDGAVEAQKLQLQLQMQMHLQSMNNFHVMPPMDLASQISDETSPSPSATSTCTPKSVDVTAHHTTQTIQAWDQIGELTSELGVSMVVRQASIICDRFAEAQKAQTQALSSALLSGANSPFEGRDNDRRVESLRPNKRARLQRDSMIRSDGTPSEDSTAGIDAETNDGPIVHANIDAAGNGNDSVDDDTSSINPVQENDMRPPVATVSCDESSGTTEASDDRLEASAQSSSTISTLSPSPNSINADSISTGDIDIPGDRGSAVCSPIEDARHLVHCAPMMSPSLSRQIDRMSRMSSLMMILEQTRTALRQEMISMMQDEDEQDELDGDQDDGTASNGISDQGANAGPLPLAASTSG